ncbi:methyltransferase domain-containing protein [Kineosporia sp. NBRC 101731]|uniref:class I SAM-dependent methyltransferase n=1 Tax=Kineosporia sp. NBRC 101731 TaxID=3032199 RepID=UPI0024A17FA2|nr:methyltransferase domain-containing protein [Kineosporia sp. NBRC 101731]GLY30389.1 hypothetical protein Kisp02_37540 [Kineosporia sp. NBRC 101731]
MQQTGTGNPPEQQTTAHLAEVFDRAAPSYDRTGVEFFSLIGQRLVARVPLRPGDDVLDLGCGRGACTFPAARAVGSGGSVTAIDVSPEMVARTAALAAGAGLGQVAVSTGDASDPAFAPGSFDAITAGLVVFMLPDPAAAIRVYHDLLRPGGTFAMSLFGADDPAFFEVTAGALPFLEGGLPPVPGRDSSPLRSRDGAQDLLRRSGLVGVELAQEHLDLVFTGPDQWWDWLWQTAGRVVLEQIPPDRLPAARAEMARRMEAVRDERGSFLTHWEVWCVRGTAPGGDRP